MKDLRFPNGVAVSKDGSFIVLCESRTGRFVSSVSLCTFLISGHSTLLNLWVTMIWSFICSVCSEMAVECDFFPLILVWIQVVAILAEGRERRYTWDLCASSWVAGQCAEQFQRRFLGCHSCSSQYSRFVSWSVSMVAVSCCALPYPPKVLIPIG